MYDSNGWIITTIDLLGRTKEYTDVYGAWTGYEYAYPTGELTRKYGDMGEEVFYYDNLRRPTQHIFDGVTYATTHYDQYSRVDYIDYNNAGQMRMTPGRDSMGRTNSVTYRMGDGTTTVSDTSTLTQSNRVASSVVASGSNQLTSTYGYDAAGRLTSATIGSNTYTYGFGAQDSSCGNGSNMNPNSGKNSNRTSQTINGVTTTFCYDYADRLVSSSNPQYSSPTYDSRGNMTTLGTYGTTPTLGWIGYDSSNRNTGFEQYDQNGNGTAVYYDRDVQGRIIGRHPNSIANWNWTATGSLFYHYTSDSDAPDSVRDANWTIVEKTIQLPGGINLTVKPQQTGNNQKAYNLPNNHGDVLLTTDAGGTNTSNGTGPASTFVYDPFGQVVPGSVLPNNTEGGSYAYVGQHQKLTESAFDLTPIQMGARLYFPGLGRFAQVDLVAGGTENNYVYPADPVNSYDLSGMFSISKFIREAIDTGRAYYHYVRGGGKTRTTNINKYSWNKRSIAKSAASTFKKASSACFVAKVQAKPTNLSGKAIIGTGTVTVGGTITIKGNKWSINGKIVGGYDEYDFNITGATRTAVGHASTFLGAAEGRMLQLSNPLLFNPKNYTHIMVGEIPLNESGKF